MRTHPHLYEIATWPWLEHLSTEEGRTVTLDTVPGKAWDGIARQGMDWVYLMGVWKRSAIGRLMARTDAGLLSQYDRALPGWHMRDVQGSPYCIQAYEPDARMGGWQGLDAARAQLAKRGIRLMLDFVPNHTAFDHEWIRNDPELFVQGTLDDYRREPDLFHPVEDPDGTIVRFFACGRDPYFPPWRDVAQLNYYNPAAREAMIGILDLVARHCDGVRCDMAMLVLNDVFKQTWADRVELLWGPPEGEFWPAATARVPMTYLAEVYWDREHQLQRQGFDYTYDKRLLERLHHGDAAQVRAHLRADAGYSARMARFLENHDEPRSAPEFGHRIRAAAALTFTLPGLRFFFDGQLSGTAVRAPVQLGRWAADPGRADAGDLYGRILRAIDRPLFHDGDWTLLDVHAAGDATHDALVATAWRHAGDLAVIVVNPASHAAQGLVRVGTLPAGNAFALRDQLADATYMWSRTDLENGLYVRLAGGDAHLFLFNAG